MRAHCSHILPPPAIVTIELSIIIVNWNTGDLLRRCLASIVSSHPAVAYEIIVVDNASDDRSLAVLRQDEAAAALMREGRLRIVENAENRGFGRANNQAFALSHAALVLLLNPDALMVPGAIESLIAVLRSDPRIGACGPRLVNPDGSLQISVWRNPPTAWEIVLSNLKLYRLLPARIRGELLLGPHWRHDRRRGVRMLSAAALMVRRETIDAVGGFDERFHMYAEDNEWCLRMARAGWLLVFEPAVVVRHDEAQSSLKRWDRLEKRRVQLEASYLFQRVSLPRRQLIANQLASYLTARAQRAWRQIRGVDATEMTMVTRVHGQHLKQSLHRRLQRRPDGN
jgi:N-acetylglucosaminyl-diphospho-decaprenol L-rhamnosyltransferase